MQAKFKFSPWLMAGLLLLPSVNLSAALKEGEKAPDFEATAALAGKDFQFKLKDARQKGPVVVYFYPSAYTGGCNLQAHTFSTKTDEFKAAGASVVGVSLDSVQRLKEFSADPEFCAGKLAVASDPDGAIAKSFAVSVRPAAPGKQDSRGAEIDHGFAERVTFVVDGDGKIAATIAGVAPVENVDKALQTVQ
ncbi:MAG TPA: redoxin domain-containing protein, partial [Dongiaceae bacterium]|nr:redoxin domain-containing protein [Dongiaceae bacterium]